MKKYNRSLDFLALAMDQLQKGKPTIAAKLLVKASKASDADQALSIIEASNSAAKLREDNARIEAAKLAKAKVVKASEETMEPDEDLSDQISDDQGQATASGKPEVSEQEMSEQLASVLASMVNTK